MSETPTKSAAAHSTQRFLELDGLRGTAILMVMMLHFWPEEFALSQLPLAGPFLTKLALGGIWGVQLFFVLSGFLITGILLDSKDETNYFRNFYARRILRIFPLYFGSLFVVFHVLPLFVTFDSAALDMQRRQVWLWTFLSNAGFSGRTWDTSTVFVLGHFWSLCVEEHYYLVWPFVVWITPARRLPLVCCGIVLLSLGFRIAGILMHEPEVPDGGILTFGTLFKLDGLAIGSLIAIAFRSAFDPGALLLRARRLFMPALAFFLFTVFWPRRLCWNSVAAICETPICLLFGAILIRVLMEDTCSWWRRVAKWRPLMFFGKYSYGLYVIHGIMRPAMSEWLPVSRFQNLVGFSPASLTLFYLTTVSLCLALAVVCYHLWERPFLCLKRFFESKPNQAAT